MLGDVGCWRITDVSRGTRWLVNVVAIATGYGLDDLGIESRWGARPALGPTQPPVQWVTGSFPGVKSGRGVTLTTHPLLVPWS